MIGSVSGFRYRLYSAEWDELGEFETIVPNWSVGNEFLTGDGRRLPRHCGNGEASRHVRTGGSAVPCAGSHLQRSHARSRPHVPGAYFICALTASGLISH